MQAPGTVLQLSILELMVRALPSEHSQRTRPPSNADSFPCLREKPVGPSEYSMNVSHRPRNPDILSLENLCGGLDQRRPSGAVASLGGKTAPLKRFRCHFCLRAFRYTCRCSSPFEMGGHVGVGPLLKWRGLSASL